MYKELLAMAEISSKLGFDDKNKKYSDAAAGLKSAVNKHCHDDLQCQRA